MLDKDESKPATFYSIDSEERRRDDGRCKDRIAKRCCGYEENIQKQERLGQTSAFMDIYATFALPTISSIRTAVSDASPVVRTLFLGGFALWNLAYSHWLVSALQRCLNSHS